MSLYITALNSGSNGNCYYVGNDKEAVLIDAGISCRETERRMKRLELDISKVKAIFISHEHSDHISGVRVLSKRYKLPVYITPGTLINSRLDRTNPFLVKLIPHEPVTIGSLSITAFPKKHDANDPQSFIVRQKDICIGIFTDIGVPCEQVIKHFNCCDAAFLEANYDDKMLAEGMYPYYLKQRISSDIGHLSNLQALSLVQEHRSASLSHIFLSHISQENNDHDLIKDLFHSNISDIEIVMTSRHEEIPVYEISKTSVMTELKI